NREGGVAQNPLPQLRGDRADLIVFQFKGGGDRDLAGNLRLLYGPTAAGKVIETLERGAVTRWYGVQSEKGLKRSGLAALVLADQACDLALNLDGGRVGDALVVMNTERLEDHRVETVLTSSCLV